MKILFVSIPSIHAIRWVENLEGTDHELYWFDVLGEGLMDTSIEITQIINWKKRKIKYIKGEYFLRKKMNKMYNSIHPFLEVTAGEYLEILLKEIQPDLVHSFEMQSCSYPILRVMSKYSHIKWLYSCWGSDLFYYKNIPNHLQKIISVLKRINFLHVDCNRDYEIAKSLGFKGKYMGSIPGGGGYKLEPYLLHVIPIKDRNIIFVKGYENNVGRGLNCIKALENIQEILKERELEVVVFGAHTIVADYIKQKKLPFSCFREKNGLTHLELLKLMGKSLVYMGNSLSDGMPNTLLEALIMGAFPIQSNPGNVTSEIINDGSNGFLIRDPNSVIQIQKLVLNSIENKSLIEKAFYINQDIVRERLEYNDIRQKIIELYQIVDAF